MVNLDVAYLSVGQEQKTAVQWNNLNVDAPTNVDITICC